MVGTDYHIHTHYVGCANETMRIPAILERCNALGRTSIAITDHRDDDGRRDKNQLIKQELERTDPGGLEVFFGCELNIQNLDADVVLDERMKSDEGFDIVAAGIHSTWRQPGDAGVPEIVERYCDLLCKVAANPLIDVVLHPWWFNEREFNEQLKAGFTSLEMVPGEWTRKLADICVKNDTAIELNTGAVLTYRAYSEPLRKSYKTYIARLVELGCLISLGTDAHDISTLDSVTVGEEMIAELEIPDDQIWRPRVEAKVAGSRLMNRKGSR